MAAMKPTTATAGASRAKELEALVRKHQGLYYDGQPELTDAEFDALWDELRALDPANEVFSTVGRDRADGFPKARHVLPMGSQEKAANPDEFLAWCRKVAHPEYVVQFKMDGASLELQYRDGVLLRAVTRGDGVTGDEITPNALRMSGVPGKLAFRWSGAVRGEVLMSRAVHGRHFPDKANCRNAANGIMKRKDGAGAERLDVVCYDAAPSGLYDAEPGGLFATGAEPPFDDELSKIEWLRSAGFVAVETRVFTDPWEIVDWRARVMAERGKLPYDIDGLVAKGRAVDIDDMRRARPERQIAFKFPLEEAVSTLLEVEWSESGATYTPIGILEPVRLAGTTVKRANLANTNTINGMGLRLGSRVMVVKRGEIIPKIEGLVENPPDARDIPVPSACGCGAALVDEGTRLFCPNPACPKKAMHRLEKWLAVLDVRDFGTAILGRLFEAGRVRRVADLYSLEPGELSGFERMGDTLAAKIVANLRARDSLSLAEFIAGFDIENIGLLIAEKAAAAGFDTLDRLRSATVEELSAIDGFGEITARALADGLSSLAGEMDAVLASGRVSIKEAAASGGALAGLTFCFTGELSSMKRSRAEALVKSLGGSARSSVAAGLSYLVTNEPGSGSAKNRKAASLGIAIIGEDEFLRLAGRD